MLSFVFLLFLYTDLIFRKYTNCSTKIRSRNSKTVRNPLIYCFLTVFGSINSNILPCKHARYLEFLSLVFTVLPFSRASSESVRGGCGRSDPKTARRQSDDNCSSHGIPRDNSDNACTFSPVREHPPRHERSE